MENYNSFFEATRYCITSCIQLLDDASHGDVVVHRLESILLAAANLETSSPLIMELISLVDTAVLLLLHDPAGMNITRRGRPRIEVSEGTLSTLLSMNFKLPTISEMLRISRSTLKRRMQDVNLSVKDTYTSIDDPSLAAVVRDILQNFPNTGYKRMKGFLIQRSIKVTEYRIRSIMRAVDPLGVYDRTKNNRAILRREYFVQYSNEMWHIDTNMKLNRWKIIIRGGIDGKSRCCVYLNAGGDNKAASNFENFLKGVNIYGVPYRCRSDKGGENVSVAKFMLDNRGVGRGSHICGRSVHNQRIERFWRDVYYGCLGSYKLIFIQLEEDGFLDVENATCMFLLHFVFLPRLQNHLELFRQGWNNHPLSTERNFTPAQLMFYHLPPAYFDISNSVIQDDLDLQINHEEDLTHMEQNPLRNFTSPTSEELGINMELLQSIDPLKASESFGYDVYVEAYNSVFRE